MDNNLLDELTLVNRDEQPFSQKALAILGGITSFGALFPLFLQNLNKFTDIKDKYIPFKTFMSGYFLFPVVILLCWLYLSRRRQLMGNPDVVIRNSSKWFLRLLGIQIVLGFIFVFFPDPESPQTFMSVWAIIYSCCGVAMLYYFLTKMFYRNRLIAITGAVITGLILLVFLVAIPKYIDGYTEKDIKRSREAYTQIGQIDEVIGSISRTEKRTRNIAERYRLVSHMQWVNDNVPDSTVAMYAAMSKDAFVFNNYSFKPYTDLFNALILLKHDHPEDNFDSLGLNSSVDYASNTFFNGRTMFNEFQKKRWEKSHVTPDSLAYISQIDDIINSSLRDGDQVITPGHLSLKDGELMQLFKKYQLVSDTTFIMGSPEYELHKRQFAHYLNELNSVQLYTWIQDFMAYTQRRAQREVQAINKNVAWILQDAQVKGLYIFITFLLSILFFYAIVSSMGDQARSAAIQSAKEGTMSSAEIKDKLDLRLKLVQHYLFPVITFMGIVIALMIPLTNPIKTDEINTSNPNWFLSMPNWNMTQAISAAVKEPSPVKDASEKEDENKITDGTLNNLVTDEELTKAVDTLIQKIDEASSNAKDVNNYIKKGS